MKHIQSIFLVLFVLLMTACSDKEEEPGLATILKPSKAYIEFKATGGKDFVEIVSDGKWSISNIPNWCIVEPSTGEKNATVSIALASNTTDSEREATLTIQADTIIRYLTIAQTLKDPTCLKVSSALLTAEPKGNEMSFEIDTDGRWSIENDGNAWYALDQLLGKNKTTVKVTVRSNDEAKNREAKITVKAGQYSHQVTIFQEMQKASFLKVAPEEVKFVYTGGEESFVIDTDGQWNIKNVPDWCTHTQLAGLGKTTITFTASANDKKTPRQAEISIVAGDFTSKVKLIQLTDLPENAIYVETAGSLKKVLTDANKLTDTDFEIHGSINEADFATLRSLQTLTSLNLKNVKLLTATKELPSNAFENCLQLISIILPDGITSLPSFSSCKNLEEVILPESVKRIEKYIFSGTKLAKINLHKGIEYVGQSAFEGCTNLVNIIIESPIAEIGNGAFKNCTNLKSVILPSQIKSIPFYAFSGCSSLTNIELPNSVKTINNYAFENCSNLKKVTLSNQIETIGDGAFSGCSSLVNIKLPNTLTSIGKSAFFNCISLAEIIIPNNIKIIEADTFSNCSSLMKVTIGKNVQRIESRAFYCDYYNCKSMFIDTIRLLATTPPHYNGAFGYDDQSPQYTLGKLIVPSASIESYKKSWFNFKTIIGE